MISKSPIQTDQATADQDLMNQTPGNQTPVNQNPVNQKQVNQNQADQKWQTIIGLEIHAQIVSNAKLFSNAPTSFGTDPNTQVSFIDAAYPGMLPVANRRCIEAAIVTGLALGGTINQRSVFARKNYFYPDLPQGYQISQFEQPVVSSGKLEIMLDEHNRKTINIERVHVEQDAGKSLHDQLPAHSLIDLNRSGVGLMEIVSCPDMNSANEAAIYVLTLRSLLRAIGTCDGNMQEGSLRVDANVSVRQPGQPLGTRCEIKNLNSTRFLRQAIDYEAQRQIKLLAAGQQVAQETRLFDSNKGTTRTMRSKEEAHDYRYFPDPDLLPIIITDTELQDLQQSLPELPSARRQRLQQQYELKYADAVILAEEKAVAEFFETCVRATAAATPHSLVVSWVLSEVFAALKRSELDISQARITPKQLATLLDRLAQDKISGPQAKQVFAAMWQAGKDADTVISELGIEQIQDDQQLRSLIDQVLANSKQQIASYQTGNLAIKGWFVGQVMKLSKGKANPKLVNNMLDDMLPTVEK